MAKIAVALIKAKLAAFVQVDKVKSCYSYENKVYKA
jgi:uncharacterized protein involved in tolerance to divalent cations